MAFYLKSGDWWYYRFREIKPHWFKGFIDFWWEETPWKSLIEWDLAEERSGWIKLDQITSDTYPTALSVGDAFDVMLINKPTPDLVSDPEFYLKKGNWWATHFSDDYETLYWIDYEDILNGKTPSTFSIETCAWAVSCFDGWEVQVKIPVKAEPEPEIKSNPKALEELDILLGLKPKPELSQDQIDHWKSIHIPQEYLNPQYSTYQPQPQNSTYQTQSRSQLISPIDVLGDRLRSILMIAPPGAGKGIIISNLVRHFKSQQPNLKFFAFDGKNMSEETGYWGEGFDAVVRVDLDRDQPAYVAESVKRLIDEAHTISMDSVLLIDELNSLIQVLENGGKLGSKDEKELCKFVYSTLIRKISTAASTGDSRNNHFWGIGQNPNLSSLGLNGGQANQLRKVAIAVKNNPLHTDQIVLATDFTGIRRDAIYRANINDLINLSPVDRAYYDSATAQWYAMPKLPNYSGFDRDKRKSCKTVGQSYDLPKSKILVGIGAQADHNFHRPAHNHHQPYSAPASHPNNVVQFPQQQNGELYRAIQYANENTPELLPHLKPLEHQNRADLIYLVSLARKHQTISAATVSQFLTSKPFVKAIKDFPNKNDLIRGLLVELSTLGYGVCSGSGSSLKFTFGLDRRKFA